MKRFLKKANRGLLLGGFALILLVIYVYVDYSSFDEEQPLINDVVKNYIESFYEKISKNDYDGMRQLVDEAWDSEPVMFEGYYENKEDLSHFFEEQKLKQHDSKYGDSSCDIRKISVSKAGPDMAKATVVYNASVESGADGEYLSPFESYTYNWYYDEENDTDTRYIYTISYEVTLYLRKTDSGWKMVQGDCWEIDSMRHEKEGE